MARIRSLKPEAFQSETLADVSLEAERTFFGLSTQVDDRGRLADKPAVINGTIWAVRSERHLHTAKDLDAELEELAAEGAICRYVGCDGKRYLHFVTWDDHQKVDRPSKSRMPRCPEHGADDYCGRHDGECPPSPREFVARPSRALDSHESGQVARGSAGEVNDGGPREDDSSQSGDDASPTGSDQGTNESSRDTREDSRGLDAGSRTLDRGSNTSPDPADPAASGDGVLINLPTGREPKGPQPGTDDDPLWLKFWAIYPRKVSRKGASDRWAKLVRSGVDPAQIVEGAKRYAAEQTRLRTPKDKIKHPDSWLNAERWTDEFEAAPVAAIPGTSGEFGYEERAAWSPLND